MYSSVTSDCQNEAKIALGLGILGNVRTKTLKAWSAAKGAKVIAQL